jgi:hypothetical protein
MKKYLPAVLIILCTMFGIAIAQEKPKSQEPEKTPPQAAATSQTGDVVSIDKAKNEIVIKDNTGAEIHFLVNASTKFTKEGKTIALTDLKTGDRIMVECEASSDGACTLKTVTVVKKPSE